MKKVYGLLLFVAMMFVLVACGGDTGGGNTSNTAVITGATDKTINVGDSFDPKAGVTAKDTATDENLTDKIVIKGAVNTAVAKVYELTYEVVGSDAKTTQVIRKITVQGGGTGTPATEIVIMHGAPQEIDPFHEAYSGKQQKERQDKQRDVEAALNVKVVYKAYPSNAPWGPDRVNAIIQATVSGTPLADIYWTTSDWTQQLAQKNAIVPVDKYMAKWGTNITPEAQQIGTYNDQFYAFMTGKPTVDVGLYYNMDLVESLGIQNPTEMYLEGNWTWSKFEAWAEAAKAKLASQGEGYAALGGVVGVWAQNMVPLNGGSLINTQAGRVAFHQQPALDTYDFLSRLLVDKQLFELNPTYDAGSAAWTAGHVLMHPGSFWFLNADNRWKTLNFPLGFVPYPANDTYKGDYVSRISGLAVFNIAAGLSAEKEELAFRVWNDLQLWQTDEEFEEEFELTLISRLNDENSVNAYLSIYDKTQLDLLNSLGISQYGSTGWMAKINTAIKTRTARTAMDEIRPIYEAALEAYLNGV